MSQRGSGGAPQRERAAFYDQAEAFTPFLGATTSDGVFIVRTRDKHIGRSLFAKQARGEMNVLARAVKTLGALYGSDAVLGKQFIDVGANIGTTTVPALLQHGFSHALALEPENENYVSLRVNALLNGLEGRIVAVCKAASNRIGTSELIVNPEQGGKHWIATDQRKKARLRSHEEVVEVETITLDRLAEEGAFDPDRTGMLWIDAQAHEGHIIEGATCLTSRGVPIVLEWDPKALDRMGDRGKLHEIAEREYSHFAGMRADPIGEGPKFWLRPVAELHDYAERFLDRSSGQRLTDLMLVRLAEDELPGDQQAGQIDLSSVLTRYTRSRSVKEEAAPAATRGRWRRSIRRVLKP